MTVLNFPSSPTVGQQYVENDVIYTWNGTFWSANNAQDLDARFVNVSGDTMTGDLTVPSLNSGPLAGFRNQIINGDFRVWQRGTVGLVSPGGNGTKYGPDRWRLGGATVQNIGRTHNAPIGFNYAVTYDGAGQIQQRIELSESLRGYFAPNSVWTFSFYSSIAPSSVVSFFGSGTGGGTGFTVTAPVEIEASVAGFARYACQVTIDQSTGAGDTHLLVAALFNGAFNFTGAQFEPGPVATPFERRPIGTELALCQRFYQVRSSGAVNAADLRPTMRATPTISGNNYDAEL